MSSPTCPMCQQEWKAQEDRDAYIRRWQEESRLHDKWSIKYDAVAQQRDELLAACRAALPFVAFFRGGWSTHTPGNINSAELTDQIIAAIRRAETTPKGEWCQCSARISESTDGYCYGCERWIRRRPAPTPYTVKSLAKVQDIAE